MAGLKKTKKKEPNANPNTVLIIFVVFLFLVTIGLGTWVYYEHDATTLMKKERNDAKKALDRYVRRKRRLELRFHIVEIIAQH